MDETTVSIIGIIIACILMFIVPLIVIADRGDDIAQLSVQTYTAEFVDTVIKNGKITNESYQRFINGIATTGNTYDIIMELKILDENTAKKITEDDPTQIGNNTYYSIFTSQIEEKLSNSKTGELILKEGDGFSVTTRNSSKTLSQSLRNIYYKIKGDDLHIIVGTASGTIAINGAT